VDKKRTWQKVGDNNPLSFKYSDGFRRRNVNHVSQSSSLRHVLLSSEWLMIPIKSYINTKCSFGGQFRFIRVRWRHICPMLFRLVGAVHKFT